MIVSIDVWEEEIDFLVKMSFQIKGTTDSFGSVVSLYISVDYGSS